MIVSDTNIIAYLLLPTAHTESAEALYKMDQEWVAPTLWRSEFRNVLALYLRKNLMSLEKAFQLQDAAESIMNQNEFDMASPQILTLVNESNCSSYDCEFVALANHLNIPLITQDKKVLETFPSTATTITEFISRY